MKSIIFFLCLAGLPLVAQDSIPDRLAEPLLEEVYDLLVVNHPATHDPGVRERLTSAYETAKLELEAAISQPGDSVTYASFVGYAGRLQSAIGCGHTELKVLPRAGLSSRQRVVRLRRTAEGIYALTYPLPVGPDTLAVGTEVLAVDGRTLPDLVPEMAEFYALNDGGQRQGATRRLLASFGREYLLRHGMRDSILLSWQDSSGVRAAWVDLRYEYPSRTTTKKKKKDYGLYFRYGKSRLGDFGHLSVASFSDSRYRGVGVKKLIRKAFSALNEVAPERLVIDLRGNTGGNLAYVTEIYSYLTGVPFRVVTNFESYSPMAKSKNLWNGLGRFLVAGVRKRGDRYYRPGVLRQIKPKPENRRYRGRVLVMIDEYTFSAAAMLAHLVQSNGRGELVGADSGNSTTATFGGFFEVFPLYEGRMSLRIPAYRIDLAKPAPGFLTPDYPVHFSGEHIREGRDPQVEKLLELFGEKKP